VKTQKRCSVKNMMETAGAVEARHDSGLMESQSRKLTPMSLKIAMRAYPADCCHAHIWDIGPYCLSAEAECGDEAAVDRC
jgi:hypothetical protein